LALDLLKACVDAQYCDVRAERALLESMGILPPEEERDVSGARSSREPLVVLQSSRKLVEGTRRLRERSRGLCERTSEIRRQCELKRLRGCSNPRGRTLILSSFKLLASSHHAGLPGPEPRPAGNMLE